MSLRCTRQSVQVLATGLGKARVERQFMEVLLDPEAGSDIHDCTADSAISLSTSAASACTRERECSGQLDFAQESYVNLEGCDELELSDALAFSGVWDRIGPSVLEIDQDVIVAVLRRQYATSTVALTQEPAFVGPRQGSAHTTVSFTQAAYRCRTFIVSAQSALTPTSIASRAGTVRIAAASALSLVSLADRGIFSRSAVSELVLSDSAVQLSSVTAKNTISLTSAAFEGLIFAKATNSLALVQSARAKELTAGPGPQYSIQLPPAVISLQQYVGTSIKMLTAQTSLAIGQGASVTRPWYRLAQSNLRTVTQVFDPVTNALIDTVEGLQDSATVARLATIPFVNHHYLQLLHQAAVTLVKATAISGSAESVLTLSDVSYKNVTGSAVNHLALTIQAVADKCLPFTSLVELVQVASHNIERSCGTESDLTLMQGLAYVIADNPALFNYSPFIGEGAVGAPTPPPATLSGPLPGLTAPFQLFYPATSPTASVTLRHLNFGNKDRLSFNRVLRETRGGTLICYADSMWPKIQTLVLSFSGLNATEKDNLLEFLEDYLGLEIGLLDWEHRYWRGVVVTPDDPVVQDDRNSFSVSFEFEGELDPTWP